MILTPTKYGKTYTLTKFLRALGFYQKTKHRLFLYYCSNTCSYSGYCAASLRQVKDMPTHTLTVCLKTSPMRLTLRLTLVYLMRTKLMVTANLDERR